MPATLPLDTPIAQAPPSPESLAAELVELKLLADEIEDRRRLCQARLEACHLLLGTDRLTAAGFTITRSTGRKVYDYSTDPAVQAAKDNLQVVQDASIAAGRAALKSQTPFWTVRPTKEAGHG